MLYILFLALGAAGLALDQWLKAYVTANIPLGQAQSLLPGVVELRTVHNYGAAWSSFSGSRWLLVAVTCIIVIFVTVLLVRRVVRHPLGVAACCMVISGGLGNIIDRVRLGYVVDMLYFPFWPSYPTFNAADVCVVSGAVLGAVYYLWFYEKHDKRGGTDGTADPADNA